MRIIIHAIFLASVIACSRAEQAVDTDYNNDETVAIEAVDDDLSNDEVNTTPLPSISGRQDVGDCPEGTCTSIKDCFPRLFPLDNSGSDTPMQSGVYNQNLALLLIERHGFCGVDSKTGEPVDSKSGVDSKAWTEKQVCCPNPKVVGDFPLDNDTSTVDSEFQKRSCGKLKIDPKDLPNDKIVGGRDAILGEMPWMVAMIRRGQQFCGASLLDSRNVLTAAHCVEFMSKNDVAALRLHIGDLDIYSSKDTNHIERRAKRVLYHRGFTMKNLAHDIALIHLDKPVEFSKTVQPVCLHPGSPPYDTGKDYADVSGWGTTSSGGSQSNTLKTVSINVITNEECNKRYAKANKMVGPGMVCAWTKDKDSCQGDSGGPLVLDPKGQAKQIGVVSWGIGCASYPGVYTRVDRYMKWINKNKL